MMKAEHLDPHFTETGGWGDGVMGFGRWTIRVIRVVIKFISSAPSVHGRILSFSSRLLHQTFLTPFGQKAIRADEQGSTMGWITFSRS